MQPDKRNIAKTKTNNNNNQEKAIFFVASQTLNLREKERNKDVKIRNGKTQKQTNATPSRSEKKINKAGYTATEVACGWAGVIFEVTSPLGQQQWGQRNKIIKKSKT